jgi:DNA mismatch endonuclease (patch repair protein)
MGMSRSENMRRIRSKDTSPEIAVRHLVYSLGFRYRLHRKDIPGKPDLVFLSRRKAIFIHGCFWHQHPGCKEAHLPKSNTKYWTPKLERNVQRDKQVMDELAAMGWGVLVVWECELADRDKLTVKLQKFISDGPAKKCHTRPTAK